MSAWDITMAGFGLDKKSKEQKAFELWAESIGLRTCRHRNGERFIYDDASTERAWQGWHARANISTTKN